MRYFILVVYTLFATGLLLLGSGLTTASLKWKLEERIKSDMMMLIKGQARALSEGLENTRIGQSEDTAIKTLAKAPRVVSLIYLNGYGEIRWHNDPSMIGIPFQKFVQRYPVPTDALEEAYRTKRPRIRPVPIREKRSKRIAAYAQQIEVAVVLQKSEKILGALDFLVDQSDVRTRMQRFVIFYWAVAGALLLVSLFFLNRWLKRKFAPPTASVA